MCLHADKEDTEAFIALMKSLGKTCIKAWKVLERGEPGDQYRGSDNRHVYSFWFPGDPWVAGVVKSNCLLTELPVLEDTSIYRGIHVYLEPPQKTMTMHNNLGVLEVWCELDDLIAVDRGFGVNGPFAAFMKVTVTEEGIEAARKLAHCHPILADGA